MSRCEHDNKIGSRLQTGMIGNINTLLSSRSNNSALDKYSPDSICQNRKWRIDGLQTVRHIPGSGGYHHYYRGHGEKQDIRSSAIGHIVHSLDIIIMIVSNCLCRGIKTALSLYKACLITSNMVTQLYELYHWYDYSSIRDKWSSKHYYHCSSDHYQGEC